MRRFALAVLVLLCASARAAAPGAAPGEGSPELVGLRSVAGWLKTHGTEGYLGAEVAKALGIAAAHGDLDARQRGFRNAAVLRIAQLLPDSSVLFMVQQDDGAVYFYHSTLSGGLRRALVALPGRTVLRLEGAQAESNFRTEVLYWEDKAGNR